MTPARYFLGVNMSSDQNNRLGDNYVAQEKQLLIKLEAVEARLELQQRLINEDREQIKLLQQQLNRNIETIVALLRR